MTPGDGCAGQAAVAWRRAAAARARAARAEEAADRHEARAEKSGRAPHAETVEALRRTAACHHSSADADPELYGGADHRDVVRQAAGMASAQAACPVDDALALLRARAFTRGVPLEDLARALVAGYLSFTPEGFLPERFAPEGFPPKGFTPKGFTPEGPS